MHSQQAGGYRVSAINTSNVRLKNLLLLSTGKFLVDLAPSASEVREDVVVMAPHENSCPKCRSTIYRRSHRRWYERFLGRPKMARCLECHHRFHYPHRLRVTA